MTYAILLYQFEAPYLTVDLGSLTTRRAGPAENPPCHQVGLIAKLMFTHENLPLPNWFGNIIIPDRDRPLTSTITIGCSGQLAFDIQYENEPPYRPPLEPILCLCIT